MESNSPLTGSILDSNSLSIQFLSIATQGNLVVKISRLMFTSVTMMN